MIPTAQDVASFLGQEQAEEDLLARAAAHLPVVTAMIKAYTRDRGFTAGEPSDDLALVILSSTARLTANPHMHNERSTAIDDASTTTKYAVFNGWTLPELAILHRYRRRAL